MTSELAGKDEVCTCGHDRQTHRFYGPKDVCEGRIVWAINWNRTCGCRRYVEANDEGNRDGR